jgi:hypothetical protein
MKLAFRIVFKKGPKVVAEVEGDGKDAGQLTVQEVTETVVATEQFLERLTGLRVHIEQVM